MRPGVPHTLGATDSEYHRDPRAAGDSALLSEQQQKVEAIAERAESCLRGVEREAVRQNPAAVFEVWGRAASQAVNGWIYVD